MKHTYLDELKPRFEFLLNERRFKIRDYEYPPKQFDNFFIDLESTDFLFRLVRDRGVIGVLIGPIGEQRKWYDMGLLSILILGPNAPQPQTLDEEAQFIKVHYEAIRDLMSEANFPNTSIRLKQIGRERMANRKRI